MRKKEDKLPRNLLRQDKVTGNKKLQKCPDCVDGKVGGKSCIACGGRGKRWQQQG